MLSKQDQQDKQFDVTMMCTWGFNKSSLNEKLQAIDSFQDRGDQFSPLQILRIELNEKTQKQRKQTNNKTLTRKQYTRAAPLQDFF